MGDVGAVDLGFEGQAIGVHEAVALLAIGLLASVVALCPLPTPAVSDDRESSMSALGVRIPARVHPRIGEGPAREGPSPKVRRCL